MSEVDLLTSFMTGAGPGGAAVYFAWQWVKETRATLAQEREERRKDAEAHAARIDQLLTERTEITRALLEAVKTIDRVDARIEAHRDG